MSTNKASKLPADSYPAILSWVRFKRRNLQLRPEDESGPGDTLKEVARYLLAFICDMDQTPLPFELLSGQTYEPRGSKSLWIKGAMIG